MSFTVSLQQRIQQLKKAQEDVPRVLAEVAKDATLRAIRRQQMPHRPQLVICVAQTPAAGN